MTSRYFSVARGISAKVGSPALGDDDASMRSASVEASGAAWKMAEAAAVMAYGRSALGLRRIVAILSHDNHRSSRLLERLGFSFEGTVKLRPDDEDLDLYANEP